VIFAVIPAAGKSVRMGRPKLLLPLGGRSVLEYTVGALREGGVSEVLVIVSPALPELARLAEQVGAKVLQLDADTADMRTTVQRGLDWLEQRYSPASEDGWFLAPADHPALEADVIQVLLQTRAAHPERSIFIPTFDGKRGHPTLLTWGHVAGIRNWPAGEGLNTYLRAHADDTELCPVGSPGILLDMDTPADYERLRGAGLKD